MGAEQQATPAVTPRPRGPEGSAYDALAGRKKSKSLARRLRRLFTQPLVAFAALTFPYVYYAYCWFVWKTSRVIDMTQSIQDAADRHDRAVGLLWHEEVFSVAYGYESHRPHTLASTGNFGRIITRMLELCSFQVFRGGSSRGRIRRKRVLVDMIRHMQSTRRVIYGITVDGSHGPAYVMKKGGVVIAKSCRAPLFVARTWTKRRLAMPTWDGTAFPLPFNTIVLWMIGPYWIAPDATEEELEVVCEHLQQELLDLTEVSYRRFEPEHVWRARKQPRARFPEGWTPRWAPGQLGIPRGPHDLRPDDPPPWAHTVAEALEREAPAAATSSPDA